MSFGFWNEAAAAAAYEIITFFYFSEIVTASTVTGLVFFSVCWITPVGNVKLIMEHVELAFKKAVDKDFLA